MQQKAVMISIPNPTTNPGRDAPGETRRSNPHRARNLTTDIPMLQKGITIAADSCSLIFLNTLHLLETYAGVHAIMLTQAIYDEITHKPATTTSTDDLALYKNLFDKRVLSVHATTVSPTHQYSALSAADHSLINAYETLKPDGILTDDKNLCRYCRKNAIPYINTPMAVFVLLYNRHLSRDQYTATLIKLYEIGRYGQFVRDYMQELYSRYCECTNQ